MSPDKPKSGVIGALSRILHLHQLPDTPPSALTPAPPVTPVSRSTPIMTGEQGPAIPPAYEGKPYVIPEARRVTTLPSTIPESRVGTQVIPSRVEATPAQPVLRTTPAIAPVRPTLTRAAPAAQPQSVWPFPAPWIKSPPKTSAPATPASTTASSPTPARSASPAVAVPKPSVTPVKFPSPSPVAATPKAASVPEAVSSSLPIPQAPDAIVTNFDRILDIVRLQKSIKLDELTKRLGMNEEKIAEELQTLEDNGLIEVRYPAFGEPIIYYKTP